MRSKANIIQLLLNNAGQNQRLIWALSIVLSCFQATSWFAVTLITYLMLRFGPKAIWNLMCANFVVNGVALYLQGMNITSAWTTAFLDYWPAYIGAIALMITRSWYVLADVMMVFAGLVGLLLHFVAPDFGAMQYQNILEYVRKLNHPMVFDVISLFKNHQTQAINMMVGMQLMFAFFNALTSLTLARSWLSNSQNVVQTQDELLNLRSSRKLLFAFLLAVIMVWKLDFSVAWYVLPSLGMYFVAIGGSILLSLVPKTKLLMTIFGGIIALMLMPYVCIPVLFGIGAIDSFVNFRFLFAKRLKTTV
jgi:hypothetical protein